MTAFSLATQAYALGLTGATLAHQLEISTFLPLAAWTIASRRGEWGDLLAATFATVAVAIPTLVVVALWETYIWPQFLAAVSPIA